MADRAKLSAKAQAAAAHCDAMTDEEEACLAGCLMGELPTCKILCGHFLSHLNDDQKECLAGCISGECDDGDGGDGEEEPK